MVFCREARVVVPLIFPLFHSFPLFSLFQYYWTDYFFSFLPLVTYFLSSCFISVFVFLLFSSFLYATFCRLCLFSLLVFLYFLSFLLPPRNFLSVFLLAFLPFFFPSTFLLFSFCFLPSYFFFLPPCNVLSFFLLFIISILLFFLFPFILPTFLFSFCFLSFLLYFIFLPLATYFAFLICLPFLLQAFLPFSPSSFLLLVFLPS